MPPPRTAIHELPTPHGPARVHVQRVASARGALVLGHGAGGGVTAPDLVAARDAALAQGLTVALVEQPYRVAGRRSPAPARQLDAAWVAVVEQLRRGALRRLPLLVGGRSSGARVACRTADALDATSVLCLAFPLRPPPRVGSPPRPDRLPELEAVRAPVLIVQGENDRFGIPPAAPPGRELVVVRGDHSLRSDGAGLTAAVAEWLPHVLAAR